jgi:BirA family transcriptional regulator, biotin operon repressor / biotin---[acetyl-CoA-carboxylase] ligase
MDKGLKGSGFEHPTALHPDEIQRNLKTARLGKKIHYFAEIDSTNNYAYKLAQKGAAEGEVVIADGQRQGKGRLGRTWVSPPHVNLYLSVILRPKFSSVHAPRLTLMSGVALAETVQAFVPHVPEIKWPNDILVGGKKLAGILTEACCEGDRILFVVVGIGVNLNFPQELMPETIRATATSILALAKQPVDRPAFARRLIQGLDQCYGDLEERGFPAMASRWESFFSLKGKRVRVEGADGSVRGKAVGIAGDGALVLEDEKGVSQRVIAGDVFPIDT